MSYKDIINGDQRLVILRFLSENQGTANESVINKVLESYGHKISRAQVKNHLYYLVEQDLIELETVLNTDVAHITDRGVDVSAGRAKVPGVGVPSVGR